MEYIIPICIFVTTFIVVCVLYDCILGYWMEKRLRETWAFINSMRDFVAAPEPEIPERIPF
tara:strand:- start:4360 stop:4542 length:183 start_codon:yes stop_codon:yes gene_type:complete